jgi:CheY-like chemotaxis protein
LPAGKVSGNFTVVFKQNFENISSLTALGFSTVVARGIFSHPAEDASMSGASQLPSRSKSILMIEDEGQSRDDTVALLQQAGFKVLCAKDAIEACAIWDRDQCSIEIMIADIVLPGRTGPEMAVQFRKNHPDLKVIFTTRTDRRTRVETEHLVRGARFLRKPFSPKTLMQMVKTELAERKSLIRDQPAFVKSALLFLISLISD